MENKISEKELADIQAIVKKEGEAREQFMSASIARKNAEVAIEEAFTTLTDLQGQMSKLQSGLQETYGNVNINITTGEYEEVAEEAEVVEE
jgi:hypothetical protein